MNSNKLLIITLLSACAYMPEVVFAEGLPSYIKINPRDKRIKPHDATGTESAPEIECSYCEGIISLTFGEPEGMAKVYVYDMGETSALLAIHTISTASTARIAVPTVPGFYRIVITTSPGNEYEGYYTIF